MERIVGVERLVAFERNRLHFLVVIVLQSAVGMRVRVMIVIVAMIVMMAMIMMMAVIMIVIVAFEESPARFEDAVEIEGVAAEHLVEWYLARAGS